MGALAGVSGEGGVRVRGRASSVVTRGVCVQDAAGDEQTREKRKLEGVTQAKFGIKNAVLGFVFGVSTGREPPAGDRVSRRPARHLLALCCRKSTR